MTADFTITVPGRKIPTSFVRILSYNDERPVYFSELTGPTSAFEIKEGVRSDKVRVTRPEQVTIETFRTIT